MTKNWLKCEVVKIPDTKNGKILGEFKRLCNNYKHITYFISLLNL